MKKSQLRNIIRESINSLMTEQQSIIPGTYVGMNSCNGAFHTANCIPNSAIPNLTVGHSFIYRKQQLPPNYTTSPRSMYVSEVTGPCNWIEPCGWNNGVYTPTPGCTFYPINMPSGNIINPGPLSSCPNAPTIGCPPCNSSQWGNHQNWINNWTNNPAFTSSNPQQPCTHICQKIIQWETACADTQNPTIQNQLACKIAEGQNQSTIHGCNC